MNAVLAAFVNGAILSAPAIAILWLALRRTPRRKLNSCTRYAMWWAGLAVTVFLPALFLPSRPIRPAPPAPPMAAETIPRTLSPQPGGLAVSPRAPSPRRPRFPVEVSAGLWPQWIVAGWALAAAIMLLRLMLSCVILERRKARALGAPAQLSGRLAGWLAQCGSKRKRVRLLISADIAAPMAAGPLCPSILIPAQLLDQLKEDEWNQIGLHEAAHLARRDDYALILQRAIEALFAVHPVVRWITRQIDLEREIACDDFVVQSLDNPGPYAACLTRMVGLAAGVDTVGLAAASAVEERSHLERRVDMLLDKTRDAGTRVRKGRLSVAMAALAVSVWIAARSPALVVFAMPPAQIERAAAQNPAPPQPPRGPASPKPAAEPRPPALPAPPQPPEPSRAASLVTISVTVQDPLGRFVTGLDKANFTLLEDGVEQEIVQISSDGPLSVGIVFDVGAGPGGKLQQAREAVAQFLKIANPEDEFFVVETDVDPVLVAGFTTNTEELRNTIARAEATGMADRPGVLALQYMQQYARYPRRMILSLSDRITDNTTRTDGILMGVSFDASLINARPFAADELAELPVAVASQGIELRNQYELVYSQNTARNGQFRRVEVRLENIRGLPPLRVRTSTGYTAPRQ